MPPQYSSINSFTVMPAGARCMPGFFTRPDTENERNPLRPLRPWPANHAAPFSTISRIQYTDSMLCSSVRRAKARHAALALDRLDHRRLFAADVRARAAPEVDRRQRARGIRLQLLQFVFEDLPAARVFIAQVDVDLGDADRPRGDQHPFQETVRVALEVPAVLEGAGLALV